MQVGACILNKRSEVNKGSNLKQYKTMKAKDGSPLVDCIKDMFPLIKDMQVKVGYPSAYYNEDVSPITKLCKAKDNFPQFLALGMYLL